MKRILTTLLICTVGFIAQGRDVISGATQQTAQKDNKQDEVTTTKNGAWSDKTIWSNNKVPDKKSCVTIKHQVSLDDDATITCLTVAEKAQLAFADKKILLQVSSSIVVKGILEAKPTTGKNIIEFTGIDESKIQGALPNMSMPDMNADPEMLDNGLWVFGKGELNLQGKTKRAWTNITDDVKMGATSILVNSTFGWETGDEIVVAPTDESEAYNVDYDDKTGELKDPFADHFERRIITGISGNTVYFKDPLKYIHSTVKSTIASKTYGNSTRSWKAEVANLTRNIVIRGTKDAYNGKGYEWQTYHRAHIMINSSAPQSIIQIEGTLLGPRKMQGARRPTLILGRYALHFHMCGDGSIGSVVKGNSFHDIGNHVFVPHLSNGITMRSNVTLNSLEIPFWWDDGSPTHDIVWDRNLAMASRWSGINSSSGFWLGQGDNVKCTNNVAVYCQRGDPHAGGSYAWNANNESPFGWVFKNNLAHSCGTGIWTWQNTSAQHFIENFDTYNTGEIFALGAYANRYVIDHGHHYNGTVFLFASGTQIYRCYFDAGGANYLAVVTPSHITAGVDYPNRFVQCVFQGYKKEATELNNPSGSSFNINDPKNNFKYLDLILCEYPTGKGIDFNNKDDVQLPNGTRARVQPISGQNWQRIKLNGIEKETIVPPFAPIHYGNGDGLVATYFNNSYLKGDPAFTRIEKEIRIIQANIDPSDIS